MAETTATGLAPTVEASDHEDVAVLLKAATALWEGGDIDGALRWFGRAAETASDLGYDRRAVELARAIADLKDRQAPPRASAAPPAPSATIPPGPSSRKPSTQPKSLPKPPSKSPPRRATSVAPQATSDAPPSNSKGESGTPGTRVSVKTSVRDPDLLIVRVLRNGQAPPTGWGEAILAPTGRGFDLPSPRE